MTWMPGLPALALQIQAPDTSLLENVSLTRIGIGAYSIMPVVERMPLRIARGRFICDGMNSG